MYWQGINKQPLISCVKQLRNNKHQEYKRFAETLLDDMDSVTLLAAALKIITKEPDATPVRLTAVEPLRSKKPQFDRKRRSNNDRGGGVEAEMIEAEPHHHVIVIVEKAEIVKVKKF